MFNCILRRQNSSGFLILHTLPFLLSAVLLSSSGLLLWQQCMRMLIRTERYSQLWELGQRYCSAPDDLLLDGANLYCERELVQGGTEGALMELRFYDRNSKKPLVNCFSYEEIN